MENPAAQNDQSIPGKESLKKHLEAAIPGTRVYEYISDDGHAYWSFHQTEAFVSPPTRLFLQSRIGTLLVTFLARLRRKGEMLTRGDTDDGVG